MENAGINGEFNKHLKCKKFIGIKKAGISYSRQEKLVFFKFGFLTKNFASRNNS